MTIGFIGVGNMASAIIKGLLKKNVFDPSAIAVYDRSIEKAEAFAEPLGISVKTDADQLVEASDIVLLAVKPVALKTVIGSIAPAVAKKNPLIVSIAAGITTEKLYTLFETKEAVRIVRVMPNMNAMSNEGAAAICKNEYATQEDLDSILTIFRAVGKAWPIAEKDFSTFTAIAGSSPAYTFLFIDSIARAAVKNGMPKDLALEIATQAVFGSAKTLEESAENPWTLIDQVSSPGGTTVAGIVALEDNAFISTVIKGIDATIQKDKELGDE